MRDLEDRIGYHFRNASLLAQAMRHASTLQDEGGRKSYQRLEFLGDAVFNLCVAAAVYHRYPDAEEGELTRVRASLINNRNLFNLGDKIGVAAAMKTDRSVQGKGSGITPKMVADGVEAIVGAIFLDGGFVPASEFIQAHLMGDASFETLASLFDAKTRLQELCQKVRQPLPSYQLVDEAGPPHAPTFHVRVLALDLEAEGVGNSKKDAEMNAATKLLTILESDTKRSTN